MGVVVFVVIVSGSTLSSSTPGFRKGEKEQACRHQVPKQKEMN
jgi:hypothetical protein